MQIVSGRMMKVGKCGKNDEESISNTVDGAEIR